MEFFNLTKLFFVMIYQCACDVEKEGVGSGSSDVEYIVACLRFDSIVIFVVYINCNDAKNLRLVIFLCDSNGQRLLLLF